MSSKMKAWMKRRDRILDLGKARTAWVRAHPFQKLPARFSASAAARAAGVPVRKNPKPKTARKVPPSVRGDVQAAIRLFKRFREAEPEFIQEIKIRFPKAGFVFGTITDIGYATTHGRKPVRYRHTFKSGAAPLGVSSADGKQLLFVGGQYSFTRDGIVDDD